MDKPILALETKHTFVWVVKSPHVRAILDYLSRPTDAQIKGLSDQLNERLNGHMKRVSTLLREFGEGLEAVKETNKMKAAKIAELEGVIADLRSRPSLSDADRAKLEDFVQQLAAETGQPFTENLEDVNDDGSAQTPIDNPPTDNPEGEIPPATEPGGIDPEGQPAE